MGTVMYNPNTDPNYQDGYIDEEKREERTLPDGSKLPYLYVHGGFRKMGVKFLFCFPEKQAYTGRFFHYLSPSPGPDEELASLPKTGGDDIITFSLKYGAYFVETNMGSRSAYEPVADEKTVWQSSAAAAEFSRRKAMELYGGARPYGYVFGGSGGGYKTMACIENTQVWDGAIPHVIGSPASLPNTIVMRVQGQRVLRHVFGKIVDAADAGGSGNLCEGLNQDEAAILKELTLLGCPPLTWFIEAGGHVDPGALPVLTPVIHNIDPGYFTDFWTVPGYQGADPESSAVRDRVQFRTTITAVHIPGTPTPRDLSQVNGVDDAWKKMLADVNGAWLEADAVPQGEDLYLEGIKVCVETGEAAGKRLMLRKIEGNYLLLGASFGLDDPNETLKQIKPGDQVLLDNSDYIAAQSYYRHQVPHEAEFHGWDQFRDENGAPALPQRPFVLSYGFNGTGTRQDGNIQCKTMVLQSLVDEATCPWCADWYRKKVIEAKGSEADFRLYYMERCIHAGYSKIESNMVTNYIGALFQALLDLSDWVEGGVEPRPTTGYRMEGGQVIPAQTAADRKGLQPVVDLTANGRNAAHVKVGDEVVLTAKAVVPAGAGRITAMDFDVTANNTLYYEHDAELSNMDGISGAKRLFKIPGTLQAYTEDGLNGAISSVSHRYEKPGTYFASVRVLSSRYAGEPDPFTLVRNLARVRIVVEE